MQTFLEEVLLSVIKEEGSIENVVFILPSKRAGTFLRSIICKKITTTQFAPDIYSIESFVEELSGLNTATHTKQFFELYQAYLTSVNGEKDDFFAFTKWGNTLLQDFNEIDRFLIDSKKLFSHISAIQEVNHWSLEKENSSLISNYLQFWNSLEDIRLNFNKILLEQGLGHQGMLYRKACANLDKYIRNSEQKYVFIGFNALNAAEEIIIQTFLQKGNASIFWDIDPYFLNDDVHDASHFIRKYQKRWSYFKEHKLKLGEGTYTDKKNIEILGLPKNVSQAKYVGNLLDSINQENTQIRETAVVLGDETLLNPILNSIPIAVYGVNITMGYPLSKTPLDSLFYTFFELYQKPESKGWYFKTVIALLSHPYLQLLFNTDKVNSTTYITNEIKKRNWVFISAAQLKSLAKEENYITILFFKETTTPIQFVEKCIQLIQEIKSKIDATTNALELEYLYRYYQIFLQLKDIVQKHSVVENLQSLFALYKEIVANETLDFKGEPLKGLQVMGMLESRNLDFETVILTSVNEGILPSGKSNNSFIPYDLKKHYNLPTYKEKDAVYTYHFYRLLQRAKNIYILYNTEPDVLEGGEKSRLIRQLLADENISGNIKERIVYPQIKAPKATLENISKDAHLVNLIKEKAVKGFSPSSLSNYIRNPIDFYKQNLLKINELNEVEETVAANTFGTIVHETLDELYQPFLNTVLVPEKLKALLPAISSVATKHFNLNYANVNINEGKNLIVFNVVLKYVSDFIKKEIEQSKKHQIKIIGLEQSLSIELNYPELDFPVILGGKLDRIDEFDGVKRIIDYKTGKVEAKHVKISDWSQITEGYDKSKAFQLLCYAYMFLDDKKANTIEAGIISFKNLKSGILKFNFNKDTIISEETIHHFKEKLKALILEICTKGIPFIEKEI